MRMLSLTALLCALAIVAAGCGDDDNNGSSGSSANTQTSDTGGGASDTGGGGAAQTLKLSADPGGALKFDKSSLTAKAGKVTITLDNPSSIPHAVEIEGKSSDTIGEGETTEVTATVKPGKFEYFCPVDGHRAAGMTGTLTVQ